MSYNEPTNEFDVIENIYTNPEKEREYALALRNPTLQFDIRPGITKTDAYDPCSESYIKLQDYFKKKGMVMHVFWHGYRIANSHHDSNVGVHADQADYQVVISLTPTHHNEDLEQYVEHVESGIRSYVYKRAMYDSNYYSKNFNLVYKDLGSLDAQELKGRFRVISTELIRYNKAVILQCQNYHVPSHGYFGESIEEGRLVEIYTIKIQTMHISPSFPYIWYYENVLNGTECDELQSLMKTAIQDKDTSKMDAIFDYKGGMLNSMVETYFNHMKDTTPSLAELLQWNQERCMDVDFSLEYMPAFFKKRWNFEMSNRVGAFSFVIHLNDNQTGLSLFNHFTQSSESIASKKGSILIYPQSWLYPICQPKIMSGDKYLITGTISFSREQPPK